MEGLTGRVSKVKKLLVYLDIGQDNALEVFAVKRKIFSVISKELLNDIFEESDGSSYFINIITDRLNLRELRK